MSVATDEDVTTAVPARPGPDRVGIVRWAADLGMGARFAVTGGRESWARTLLTAVGVGLGVTLLLVASAIPNMISARSDRTDDRRYSGAISGPGENMTPGPGTLRVALVSTTYHESYVAGTMMSADGGAPPVPPGLTKLPAPGEMVVSPALEKLLTADDGKLLAERLDRRIVGTIGDEGLSGPGELVFYAGAGPDDFTGTDDHRIDHFGGSSEPVELPPALLLLVIIGCIVLLLPVVIFIATAVRFGSERRDRRLAALRLVGADSHMTRRIAAGESLCGALVGLAVGWALFLLTREYIGTVTLWDFSVFASDVQPAAPLATLIGLAVPACAVIVTLVALRGITIEPLGVVRNAKPKRRRLWWRLLLPVLGLALLLPLVGGDGASGATTYQVALGAVLFLIGTTALLPWLVEAVVERFGKGPVPWQLATRRLQLSSGAAARAVSGITVAVAGAIAIQMLFASVESNSTEETGQDPTRAQMMSSIDVSNGRQARDVIEKFRDTKGVRSVLGVTEATAVQAGSKAKAPDGVPPVVHITVADCASLRELAKIGSCEDGDAFVTKSLYERGPDIAKPGAAVNLHVGEDSPYPTGKPWLWTIPETASEAGFKKDPMGRETPGVLATPSALDVSQLSHPSVTSMLQLDPNEPEAIEYARNTNAELSPGMDIFTLSSSAESEVFGVIRRALFVGATGTLLLIGASMIVSTLEQLRERKRLLSVLVAFGTRRSTVSWSILWQTAVPVVLGLGLSIAGGLALGAVLLKMVSEPVSVDWAGLATMTGIGAGVILLVTLVSLPPLWRMMRPEGLRTE